jgi:hypothetical protein
MSQIAEYCDKLKNAGLARTESDVSQLMGKGPSYISSKKAKGKDASVEALTHLFVVLDQELKDMEDEILFGQDLSADRFVAASIVFQLKNAVWGRLRSRCQQGGADHG